MQIDKQQILQLLQSRGDQQQASTADQQLPQQVDTDDPQHQNILQSLGLNPMDLAKQFLGGKIPGF